MYRNWMVSLGLVCFVVASAAADRKTSTMADHMRLMTESKLTYEVLGGGAVKKPARGLTCPARHTQLRVVVTAEGKQLVFWEPKPEAKELFQAAEEHFKAKRLAEAGAAYTKGLALDPDYGPGWLYGGDVPYLSGLYEEALESFRKAIALDPTLPQGHRFAGDALLKLGRYPEAREEYILALSYDPSYKNVLDALEILGKRAGFSIARPPVLDLPKDFLGERVGDTVELSWDSAQHPEWLPYVTCKAVWRYEDKYRAERLGQQAGTDYSWSLAEETECVASLYASLYASAEEAVKATHKKVRGKRAKVTEADLLAAGSPLLRHLDSVVKAELLDGFVWYAVVGQQCAMTVSLLPDESRQSLVSYIRRFIVGEMPAVPLP